MRLCLLAPLLAALLCAVHPADAEPSGASACAATAARAASDARIAQAIAEARRQHALFGGQTVERNGGMFRVGYHEAEWDRPVGEPVAAWQRVAAFWQALAPSDPPQLMTSAGLVSRADVSPDAATKAGKPTRTETAVREALLRAAIVDTPWSAAFISYVMKTAGFAGAEFAFSDSHVDYVRAAFDASAAEAQGRDAVHAFRACDVATTPPRAGDLVCATRASTADVATFEALRAAIALRSPGQAFPMHCELVVRSDERGDAKLDSIGGNVVQSVTLSRMTLNARKVLSDAYITGARTGQDCARAARTCRDHLSRRPWVVVLQFRP